MHFGLQGKLCQLTCVNYKLKFNKEEPLNFTARLIMRKKENRTKKMILIIALVVFCIALILGGIMIYGRYQMSKIPKLSFQEILEYTTKDNADAVITVGIVKDGQISYKVYGENGKELPAELHIYEIGSLTKTFTAALISKAIQEEKINIDCTIDNYLSLPEGNTYPTIEELLTHTSGYKGYYLESLIISHKMNHQYSSEHHQYQ